MPNAPETTSPRKQRVDFDSLPVTPADVRAAAATIRGAVIATECNRSRTLGDLCGCDIWLTFENLQFTSTFKERGALNRLIALSADERRRGVIAMSAGNHAQGVAYHAKRLGIPATIVMPLGTPMVKIENTRRHGAEVIVTANTLEEAGAFALDHGKARGMTLIHPYDDPKVIAGQGTIALEMLEQAPDLEMLVIPVGGGGLIAGNAVAARSVASAIEIIGAEAALYPSVWNALHGGDRPCGGPTLAEGIAVKNVGVLTFPIVKELVAEIVLVDEVHLERAVNAYLTLQKTMAEEKTSRIQDDRG